MGVELIKLSNNVLMLIVSGELAQAELAKAQQDAARSIAYLDHVRVVVIAEDFLGWKQGDDWSDMSFQLENDAKIERMALVGDRKWKELVLAFVGQGFREFPIAYFERGEMAKARTWALAP